MSEAKNKAVVLKAQAGDAAMPDYFKLAGSFKKRLLDVARRMKGAAPKDVLKRLMIEKASELDESFVHGDAVGALSRALDENTFRLLASYHGFFLVYLKLTEGFFSDEEAQAILRGMVSVPGQIVDLGSKVKAEGHRTRKQNLDEHEKTRIVARDAVLEKRERGGQKREQDARVQEAMDRMAEVIKRTGMSVEDAAQDVWDGYAQQKKPLGLSPKRLANRYRDERGPKPRPRS